MNGNVAFLPNCFGYKLRDVYWFSTGRAYLWGVGALRWEQFFPIIFWGNDHRLEGRLCLIWVLKIFPIYPQKTTLAESYCVTRTKGVAIHTPTDSRDSLVSVWVWAHSLIRLVQSPTAERFNGGENYQIILPISAFVFPFFLILFFCGLSKKKYINWKILCTV